MEKKEFYSATELARRIGMSRRFVEKHIGTRRLPGMVRMGNRWMFRAGDVEKALGSGNLLLPK